MRTEKLEPEDRSQTETPERQEKRDGIIRKERETRDDGRYIIFYEFEDVQGGSD